MGTLQRAVCLFSNDFVVFVAQPVVYYLVIAVIISIPLNISRM